MLSLGLLIPFGAGTAADRVAHTVAAFADAGPSKHVTLVHDGLSETIETKADTADALLAERNLSRAPEDALSVDPASPLYDGDVSYQWPTFSAAPAGSPKSWTDAMWDQLLQQERTTVDAPARLQILQHMGQYLRDQAPYLFLFNSQWVFGWTNKVQSFDTASAGFHMIVDQAYKTA